MTFRQRANSAVVPLASPANYPIAECHVQAVAGLHRGRSYGGSHGDTRADCGRLLCKAKRALLDTGGSTRPRGPLHSHDEVLAAIGGREVARPAWGVPSRAYCRA